MPGPTLMIQPTAVDVFLIVMMQKTAPKAPSSARIRKTL